MFWQYLRARKFTQFKRMLISEVQPKVISAINIEMESTRSDLLPNTDTHQQATQFYWTQYPVRVLQAAMIWGIIDEDWLKQTGNTRNSQHLFHIQQHLVNHQAQFREPSSK